MGPGEAHRRLARLARRWQVELESVTETTSALLGFGARLGRPVVLRIARPGYGEERAGSVARAFSSRGMVTVHEEAPGAALLERLVPGTRLTAVVMGGDDPKAVEVLVEVVSLLHASPCRLEGIPCARDLGRGFESYLASQDERLPRDLIARARERWDTLCDTQRTPRLLHGDLQHENVLLDRRRGWTAIDPKGVVAELEFELGPALRNPPDRPDLYGRTSEVERRLDVIGRHLAVDIGRVVDWAWSQALLSAVWTIEDGGDPAPSDPALLLAATLEPMLS